MVAAGLLLAMGEARGRSYVAGERLRALFDRARQQFPFIAVDPFTEAAG